MRTSISIGVCWRSDGENDSRPLELTRYTVFIHQRCLQRFRSLRRMMMQKLTTVPLEIFRMSNFFSGPSCPDDQIHGVSLR